MIKEDFVEYIQSSIKKNWDIPALSDYEGISYKYSEVGELITKLHYLFSETGIKKGDKISLISNNAANWAVIYLATFTYGAVVVPILSDFKPGDIHHIVDHSDSKLLFSANSIWKNLDIKKMKKLYSVFSVDDFELLSAKGNNNMNDIFREKHPEGLKAEDIKFDIPDKNELAVISYTSGTTGFSKGVMLTHNSLAANIRYARNNMPLNSGDPILSLLTIAHVFGMVFDFLFPFSLGCHITLLTRIPSLPVLTKAYSDIKPRLILLVPLIMEKIYKNKLVPVIKKPVMRVLLSVPGLKNLLYKSINKKISAVFGGQFREVVLGGAAFNRDAETFFTNMKFPFTIGYGMTECAPLISYSSWREHEPESCGKAVDTLEVKIDSEDPVLVTGEIMVRGDNVMQGYYKNPEATGLVLSKDGWLRTGDLGIIDKEGNIYIKGRNKSMILGPSGKNIYPEEIESFINTKFLVLESIIVEREGKLIALMVPDRDKMKSKGIKDEDLKKKFEEYRIKLNKKLPSHVTIAGCEIYNEEFEKTPKKSIKRFKYK